jgi:hypothetical protein
MRMRMRTAMMVMNLQVVAPSRSAQARPCGSSIASQRTAAAVAVTAS